MLTGLGLYRVASVLNYRRRPIIDMIVTWLETWKIDQTGYIIALTQKFKKDVA